MEDDTTENKKYISSVLDLFSIPNFLHKEGPATRSQVREETWMQRNTTRQINFKGGVERKSMKTFTIDFIRDKFFRKTMIELGRSEEIIP